MPHKAILVKYLSCTNHKPTRVKAIVNRKQKVATIYKLTDMNMKTYRGYPWTLGKWNRTSGKGDLCGPGWLHAYTSPVLAELLDPIHANFREYRLFRGEASGQVIRDSGLKVGYTNMRITEELPRLHITPENRIRFGIACACRVYTSAEYRAWAGRWVSGADRTEAAARAARTAVWAAEAARAARIAVWAAEAAARTAVGLPLCDLATWAVGNDDLTAIL